MAQEKLLFFIRCLSVLIMLIIAPKAIWASPEASLKETESWLQSLRSQFRPEDMAEEFENITGSSFQLQQDDKPLLKIFVSSSMPKEALASLLAEAKTFGSILVLNGLPENSWRVLGDLVLAIADMDAEVPIQIDEEEFNNFGITSVPAFVLTNPRSQQEELEEKPLVFDKVLGNITTRLALQYMKEEGDLREIAAEYLAGKYAK